VLILLQTIVFLLKAKSFAWLNRTGNLLPAMFSSRISYIVKFKETINTRFTISSKAV